jgi:type I restriction enzyme S subunit
MVNLNEKILGRLRVPVPAIAEQRRILEVLQVRRGIISGESRKIEKLKLVRQGLMEDLLSGRVRVPVNG